MSQRNPMNDRYNGDEGRGKSRKSAASAKPKAKAAATVVASASKKTKQQKKADAKAERKKQQEAQRELDRKYYTPDTARYRKLRTLWWVCLVGGIICVAVSFLFREQLPEVLAMVVLFAAYAFIIAAFYIDLSKIRKERQAYQKRMVELEEAEAKKRRAEARAQRSRAQGPGKGKGAKGKAAPAEDEAPAEQPEQPEQPAKKRRGFFGSGFRLPKSEAASPDAADAPNADEKETAPAAGK